MVNNNFALRGEIPIVRTKIRLEYKEVKIFPRIFQNFSPEYDNGIGKPPLYLQTVTRKTTFYTVA